MNNVFFSDDAGNVFDSRQVTSVMIEKAYRKSSVVISFRDGKEWSYLCMSRAEAIHLRDRFIEMLGSAITPLPGKRWDQYSSKVRQPIVIRPGGTENDGGLQSPKEEDEDEDEEDH